MQLHCTLVRYMESYKAFKAFSDSQIEGVHVAPSPHPAASNLLHYLAQPCTALHFVLARLSRPTGFVAKHKKTVDQFMEMCAKVSEAAPQVQAFIDILTASSEFQVFVVSSQIAARCLLGCHLERNRSRL